jgi:hypothetical protein
LGVTRFRAFALALGLAGIVGLLVALPALAAGTTVTVTPSNMQGWFFLTENPVDGIGTGTLVAGPATPPLGAGSARLPAPATTDGQALVSSAYQGTKLADISQLQYSTYVTSASGPQAIALQFTVDRDVTDVTDVFNGRLVFEPYQGAPAGTVQQGTWQTWSPLQGLWWGTGSDPSSRPFGAACPQSNPCTWEKILTLFPDAGILEGDPNGIVFKAGSGWSNFSGNIDKFVIGINGTDTTYDFEAVSLPTYTTSFLSPFDSSSGQAVIKNLTKAGRVIPVKIRILENGVAYDGSKPAPTIRVSQPFACDGSAPSDALPDVTAAGQANTGTSFRWSADAPGFWIYNLDTKSLNLQVDKCYRIDVLVGTTVVTTQTYGILQITK